VWFNSLQKPTVAFMHLTVAGPTTQIDNQKELKELNMFTF